MKILNLAICKYDPPGIQSKNCRGGEEYGRFQAAKIPQQQPWSIYSDLNGTTRSCLVEKTNNLYLKTDDNPISCYTRRGLASTYVKKEDGIFVKTIKKGSQHQGLTFQVSASWQYKTVMVEPLAFNLGPIQVAFCEMWMTFKKWMCKQTALIA